MFANAEEMNKNILDGFRKAKDLLDSSQWTDKPPIKDGWYWVKRKGWTQPFVYWHEVDNDYVGYVGSDIHIREVELWLGPIPEPEMPKG